MKTNVYLWCLTEFFVKRELFQTKVVEKTKHILFSVTFLENPAVYEIMRKKYYRAYRPQITVYVLHAFDMQDT